MEVEDNSFIFNPMDSKWCLTTHKIDGLSVYDVRAEHLFDVEMFGNGYNFILVEPITYEQTILKLWHRLFTYQTMGELW